MNLIVISSPVPIADEALLINRLFEAGLEYFHLRKPDYSEQQVRELLRQFDSVHYPKIALHQHHNLASAFGISRLHFPEKNRSVLDAKTIDELQASDYQLSTSFHDLETLKQLPACFAYTFFGPVFNSLSKPGYRSAVPAGFRLSETVRNVAVIALGGIDEKHIAQVREMQFDGAALLGMLWNNPETALDNFKKIRNLCQLPVPAL